MSDYMILECASRLHIQFAQFSTSVQLVQRSGVFITKFIALIRVNCILVITALIESLAVNVIDAALS